MSKTKDWLMNLQQDFEASMEQTTYTTSKPKKSMIIEFELTEKKVITFNLDETETSKFLRWQLPQEGLDEKEVLNYLKERDVNRRVVYFPIEVDNMISVDEDDEE
jgi:hypothetical protein